ncbi:MAG: EAL domain-containing protein [Egicoccus sp.]
MRQRILALAKAGPRSADDRWPMLQRVRWRFVLLNLVGVPLMPLGLPYVAATPGARPAVYALAVLALAAWTVVLYRSAGRPLAVRLAGPALLIVVGVASGHHTWAFGGLFMSLFLHSLYGSRRQVLWTAFAYWFAYETAVWMTAGREEFLSTQLVSMALSIAVMALVMGEMGSLLRRSDDSRRREDVLTAAGRDLLRAADTAQVAQVAINGTLALAAEADTSPNDISLWRHQHGWLVLAAQYGEAQPTDRVEIDALPPEAVRLYLQNRPVRLSPDELLSARRAVGRPDDGTRLHALALPLTDGEQATGSLFVTTPQPLPDATVQALARFVGEVSLAERAARRNELLSGVLANSADGIVLVDHAGSLAFVSPAIAELVGHEIEVGSELRELLYAADEQRPVQDLADLDRHAGALVVRCADGSDLEVEVSTRSVAGEGTVLNVRNVSRQRQLQEEIRYRAYHDDLTGLANRPRFLERLEAALGDAADTGRRVAVALLDLDDFKLINDARGHHAGDRVLCDVAARVNARVRASDTFARIGGDEFALLLDDLDPGVDVVDLVADILVVLDEPLDLEGHRMAMRASCGVVVCRDEQTAEEALGDADIAMYAGKASGKDAIVLFDAALREQIEERRALKDDLEHGIARDELRLHYQPVLALATQDVIGVEALVRWQHPDRGLLFPDRFIPIAEESGLVDALGNWVLLTALHDLAGWLAQGVAGPGFQMHVNLSAHQLADPGLVSDVRVVLQSLGVDPAHLVLEITETALTASPELAEETLRQLRGLGIEIAIDDFGTGYASFTYLRRFPVGIVKIDRSFVTDVAEGPEESALARAIVRLAQSLGMTTVAEGIADESSRLLLERWGCDHGQGWLWARALPADDLVAWLELQANAPVAGFATT